MKFPVQKSLIWLCAAASVIFLLLLMRAEVNLQRTRADIRLTRDVVFRIDAERGHALKSDVPQALRYLQMFEESDEPDTGFEKHLAAIISLQKRVASRDV